MALNKVITPHSQQICFKPVDMQFIHVWPKQKKLAKMYCSILADELKKDMAAVNRQAASWFASRRATLMSGLKQKHWGQLLAGRGAVQGFRQCDSQTTSRMVY